MLRVGELIEEGKARDAVAGREHLEISFQRYRGAGDIDNAGKVLCEGAGGRAQPLAGRIDKQGAEAVFIKIDLSLLEAAKRPDPL